MSNLSPAFENRAFSVTKASCATGGYTFGHELGHNYGCAHDHPAVDPGIFDYSYGFTTASNVYRTMMSRSGSYRILYWSNPNKTAPNGEVLGVPELDTEPAENWKSLNQAATTISAWRTASDIGKKVATLFASDDGFFGNMFDIRPKTDLTLTGMDVNTAAASGEVVTVSVFFRRSSHVGKEDLGNGWFPLGQGLAFSNGPDSPTPVLIDLDGVTFEAGDTYGLYVALTDGSEMRYTIGAPTNFQNNDLEIVTGSGKGLGFAGPTVADRQWNGCLYYRGADGSGELTTLFAANNGFAGNMFDVETKGKKLRVHSLDVNVDTFEPITVDVWFRVGSYQGHESDAYDWKFLGTDALASSAGANNPTRVSLRPFVLQPNTTYGIYVHLASHDPNGQTLRYTNGSDEFENVHMKVTAGVGKGAEAFDGATFPDRTWNGTLHYTVVPRIRFMPPMR
jgi:hypothetical protein